MFYDLWAPTLVNSMFTKYWDLHVSGKNNFRHCLRPERCMRAWLSANVWAFLFLMCSSIIPLMGGIGQMPSISQLEKTAWPHFASSSPLPCVAGWACCWKVLALWAPAYLDWSM